MAFDEMARRAYGTAQASTRPPRKLEYDALAQVTYRLKSAAQKGKAGFAELAAAIHDNRQLWSLFAAQVAEEDNALPQDLRAQLFYLAEFTHHQSSEILTGKAPVRPLLEVNMAILRGLNDTRAAA